MPNIIISDKCNLQCPYCFAEDVMKQNFNFIKYEDFSKILNWFTESYEEIEQIGIIGGEPTLHPMFLSIMDLLNKYCATLNIEGLVFTNGILLKPYMKHMGDNIGFLVNCNSPKYQTKKQYEQLLDTLYTAKKMGWIETDRMRVGCNIFLDLNDYSYFWNDIVDKIDARFIRCSVVSPGGCYAQEWANQEKKEEYYKKLKPIFMQFMREAIKRNIIVGLDCNQIPMCYFSEEEQKELIPYMEYPPYSVCRPPIDIKPDLTATSCFGAHNTKIEQSKITDFNSISELRQFLFLMHNAQKASLNDGGKCSKCNYYNEMQCQGGCLAFAQDSQ